MDWKSNAVEEISAIAFVSCDSLKTFTVSSDNKYYSAKQGMLLNKEGNSVGGNDVASITVTAHDILSAPKIPTKIGYKFAGWHTFASGDKKVPFPYKVKGNMTLYAHWSK